MSAPEGDEGRCVAGRYQIEALLGRGGMASVFRARHTVTGRRVALKVLHPRPHWNPGEVERFVREARIVAKLSHPNLVEVLDAGADDDGAPFLVLELLDGETLRARMERLGVITADEVRSVLRSVLSALDAAHRAGVVHRDVKPENVFVAREADGGERVRLLDFGISKVLHTHRGTLDPDSLTHEGHLVGTVAYMSPEQLRGEEVDGRADLWSVGVMTHEMLTGRAPFTGRTAPLLTMSVLMTRAPSVVAHPGVPAGLARLVDALLARSRDERPASAAEALRRLEAPDPVATPAPTVATGADTAPRPREAEAPPRSRRAVLTVALTAVVTSLSMLALSPPRAAVPRAPAPPRSARAVALPAPSRATVASVGAPDAPRVERPAELDAGAESAPHAVSRPRRAGPARPSVAASPTPSSLAPMRPAIDIDGT